VKQPVVFKPKLNARISTNNIFYGCAPQKITFSFDSSRTGATTLSWNFGDGTTFTGTPVTHTYQNAGTYTIQLIVSDTNSCNFSDTSLFILDVYNAPLAGFFDNRPNIIIPGTEITFVDTSLLSVNRIWDWGDKATSTDSISVHSFIAGGKYQVCLIASSAEGCTDSICTYLEVFPLEEIYVPNSFTPNGDGKNDVFKPETIGIFEMKVTILNRWGDVIKEWNGFDGYWDGKSNGKKAPEDVYIYHIEAAGSINPVITKVGRVTLIY
jgi:gliding motility-associated-like protein